MSTVTAPYRSELPVGKDGFLQLLRAEWTKFRSAPGWVISMLVAGAAIIAVGVFSTASDGRGDNPAAKIAIGPDGKGVNDSFYFVRQRLDGDGSITVPVTGLVGSTDLAPGVVRDEVQPWAKAGIIMKQSLDQGSRYAAIMVTGEHGVRWQYDYTEDKAGSAGAAPRWLRLVRSGTTITGYESTDGSTWAEVGSTSLSGLGATVEAGMFVTSPVAITVTSFGTGTYNPASATGQFGEPELQGQWSGSWQGEQFGRTGTSGQYPPGTSGGHEPTGDGFTITGAGDIAPIVGGGAQGSGHTVEGLVIGAFAGLLVVVVVGTMYITSEYRRGLIRMTLAASPRRGRVLVAKAIVLGSVTFVTSLVATVVCYLLGRKIDEANGLYFYPTSTATEVRVLVGTAALLTLAAVLALAIGTVLRSNAGAVTVGIVSMVLPYMLAVVPGLPVSVSEWLLRVTPAAGFSIRQSLPEYQQVVSTYIPSAGYFPLSPWGGFGVLCAYTAVAFVVAVVLLRRRDA
ncbi:ABC transporter permease subunit [Micromonospora sp. CPCC 205371]|nr:ABC transporter permease subunit [Micromonospora sp. CPCC 205371]